MEDRRSAHELLELSNWGLDGLIVSLEGASHKVVDAVAALNLPIVNIGVSPVDFPTVSVCAKSIARLVSNHLRRRSVTSLAFVSTAHHQRLANALAQESADHNWEFQHVETDVSDSMLLDPILCGRFERLIASVRRPSQQMAIVTSCDLIAVGASQMVQQYSDDPGLTALISCRESLLCGMPDDSITAVQEPSYELGMAAARMMQSLLDGQTPARHCTLDAMDLVVRTGNELGVFHIVKQLRKAACQV